MRGAGLFIGLVWAMLWTVFLAASALSQGFGPITSEEIAPSVMLALGALFLWVSLVIAWRRWFTGGIMLLSSGLLLAGYLWVAIGRIDLPGIVLVMLGMALPPIIAGLLFFAGLERRERLKKRPLSRRLLSSGRRRPVLR